MWSQTVDRGIIKLDMIPSKVFSVQWRLALNKSSCTCQNKQMIIITESLMFLQKQFGKKLRINMLQNMVGYSPSKMKSTIITYG